MSEQYPLYPELTEEGKQEAVALIESFKVAVSRAAEEVIGNLYADILPYIETDSWTNYRNELMDGLRNYNNRKIQAQYDFKKIRQAILEEHREDIIADLNQDMVEEIYTLKAELKLERESRRY